VPVAPAWGAHGRRVVIALFPQMVAQTLDRMAAPDVKQRCILSNPDFVRGRKLMPPNSSSIVYNDTRLGAAEAYKIFLPLATAGFSFAGANGIGLDVSTIPTQHVVTRHLFGDVSSLSHGPDGFLFTSHGPLPLPIPSIGAGGSTAAAAMMASIFVPSFARARELSKRVVSKANLQGIGLACRAYAFAHHDKFPPDLEELVTRRHIARKQLISPCDPRLSPTEASRGDCSYVYIAGQTLKLDPRNVLAYEPDYTGEWGNVLFVDGRVDWIRPPRFQRVIDETYERLGRKAP
jgi:prepilin-type processing-associated H-X9-DG protein